MDPLTDPFAPWAALLLGISGVVYLLAWLRHRQRRAAGGPLGARALVAYVFGLGLLAFTLFGPLDASADASLAAHLSQHMLLLAVVPPLLLLGRPVLAFAQLAPADAAPVLRLGGQLRRGLRAHAVLAILACTAAMWLWHAPVALHHALANDAVHWLMHLSFLAAGLWFWTIPLDALRGRQSAPWEALAGLLALMMQMGLIGALLTLSPRPLVPLQAGRALSVGIDPLTDQQLAGVLMWVPFCLPYLAAAVLLALRAARSRMSQHSADCKAHDSAEVDS